MPRFPPFLPPALRLSTVVGVAVLEAASSRAITTWPPLLHYFFSRVVATADPTTTSVANASVRTCFSRAKQLFSPGGLLLRSNCVSDDVRRVSPGYIASRTKTTAAFSFETPPARPEESASVPLGSRSIRLTPLTKDHLCTENRARSICGTQPAAKSSRGLPLFGIRSWIDFSSKSLVSAGGGSSPGRSFVTVTHFPFAVGADAALSSFARNLSSASANMAFKLPPLPYDMGALAPHISAETLQFHHGKHHAAYVNKLNELVKGTKFESLSLEDVIRQASGPMFNQAAQAWNHTFYFNCMKSKKDGGGGEPQGQLREALLKKWNSYDTFKDEFSKVAAGHFGSGWAWLNYNKNKKELEIQQTHDAGNPLTEGHLTPVLCCDVWEHAYYIDRRNDRAAYIKAWWEVINWDFAEKNYVAATK